MAINKVERLGTCAFCGENGVIERHHVSYRPEKTLNLCHKCHFKVHYFPMRLSRQELMQLLKVKLTGSEISKVFKTEKSLNEELDAFALSLSYHSKNQDESLKIYQETLAPSRKKEGFQEKSR